MLRPCALALLWSAVARGAETPLDSRLIPDQGKLPLTAGFTDIDGAGGGGLVPWALITGYGSADSWGANVHYTAAPLRDFRLQSYGAALGVLDRVEVSFAQDVFDSTGSALAGLEVEQHIAGVKLRLTGDAVYDQDSWLPQTAVGAEYKRNTGVGGVAGIDRVQQLGAESDRGWDWYLSATKIVLAQSLLFDLTLRDTRANQLGLLGFGGDLRRARSLRAEGTLAYLLSTRVAVGGEYRQRPRDLIADDESGAWDAFVAFTASRHVSLVGAFLHLGGILAPVTHRAGAEQGAYVSLQVGF